MGRSLAGWLLTGATAGILAAPLPEIRVETPDGKLSANIRQHLTVAEVPCDRPPKALERLHPQIAKETNAAARALGYYHARLKALRFRREGGCWKLELQVDPGPRIRITSITVEMEGEAAADPAFARLHANLPLHPGDPLDHGRYEELKQQFRNLALRRGYFDARFRVHQLRVDPAQNHATIRLVFDSGPRYAIGSIHLRQDILHPAFVRRYFNIHPGRPYEAASLAQLHRRLADSDYFSTVRIDTRLQKIPRPEVPVTVTMEAKKRRQYRVGVGFDTNTGPRLSFGYQDRYLNRRGHRTHADLHLSFVDSKLSAGYLIPLEDPLRENLRLSTGLRHQQLDTFTSNQAVLSAAYAHPRGFWNETWSMGINYERSRSDGENPVQSLLLLPGGGWTHRKIQERGGRITQGHKFDFAIQGGATLLGDSTRFLRARLWGKYVWSLPWRARLIHRWELGALGTTRFGNVPASFRFYAGGDASIRGYGYQRLGPRDDTGKVGGGRYLGVASLEYEQRIWNGFGMAGFVDGGNAYGNLRGLWPATRFGAGVGLRWFSPVGLVRLDVATPVIHDEFQIRIHFAIGALL